MESGTERMTKQIMSTHQLEPNKIGIWRNEMSIAERKSFEAIAAPMLRELVYEID